MNTVDIRTKIYRLISSITPFDNIEEKDIHFALNWIESKADIFRIEKPNIPDIHLVSYFVVTSPEMDQFLLVDHKKAKLWLPPGGHVEPNEDPKDAVIREAKEELGITADFLFNDPILLTVTKTIENHSDIEHTDVSLWYVLKADPNQPLDYDRDEFDQIQWFDVNKIPFSNSDPHMKRFIEKMASLSKN